MYLLSRRALVVLACAAGAFGSAMAQSSYPGQPIKMIVPFPPAGGTDAVARLVGEKLQSVAGWAVVIDNKPGAGGNIGMDVLAKSKPDGLTLAMGQTSNLAINPALYAKMPYDAHKDVVAVALVATQPMVLVVRADAPYKTLGDLVAAAKSKPGELTMASAGNGTVGHLTGELFARRAGFQHVHVPYKGAGPAITDLLGGQVTYYLSTPQAVAGFVKAGRVRALAVSSAKRLPMLPDTPTISESGYKGFDTTDWKMVVAPAGTPADVVKRVNAEVQKILGKPETMATLLAEGSLPTTGPPEQAAQFLRAEQQRWGAVVRDAKVKVD